MDRLKGKVAMVVGAGSIGPGWGNGKATAVTFAREGAQVFCVDRNGAAAEETAKIITDEGGKASSFTADVSRSAEIEAMVAACLKAQGRIDVLDNNVGIAEMGNVVEVKEAEWDRVFAVNLKSAFLAMKHVIPIMRAQKSGVIINISSMAVITTYPYVAYKATKSAMVSFTEQLAYQNAEYGVRANAILPGLMNTPMAVDTRARVTGKTRAEIAAMRDAKVPLRKKMGTAWDVANAALFLASDEANFITGVALPVDGGALVKIGVSG